MELICTVYPVDDLEATAKQYLELGFKDVARPDQDTVLMSTDQSRYVEVMLERHPAESAAGAGPVFRMPDVAAFHEANPSLDWVFAPVELPTGGYAIFRDPSGNPVRIVDFSRDSGRYARLFRPSAS